MKKLHANVWVGCFFTLFSIFMLFQTIGIAKENPGSAIFPRIILSLMLIISIAIAVRGLFSDKEDVHWKIEKKDLLRVALLLLAILAFILLLKRIGYVLTAMIFLCAALLCFGNRKWLTITLVTIIVSFAVYLVFTRALGVHLPGLGIL